jgi:hypothetical protein
MYENVLNNIVKVADGIGVLLATPYITIRMMEDIGSSDGKHVNNYPWLNYHVNVP